MLDSLNEPDLGYIFYPYETMDHPGHPRLDVIIRETPTYHHFDPRMADFGVVSHTGHIAHLSIRHPWTLGRKYRVCAGRIILSDRENKRVEAFSFGGELQIQSEAQQTICTLKSNAPIFPLYTTHDLPMWITAEVECILAKQRAHWDPNHPHDFAAHLAAIDPFLLYASCLVAIRDRNDHQYLEVDELDHQGDQIVRAEIQKFKKMGKWPLLRPTLAQLFRSEIKKPDKSTRYYGQII